MAPRVVTHGHDGATSFRFPSARTVLAQRLGVLATRRRRRWVSHLIGEDKPERPEDEHVVDWVSGAAMLMPAADLRAVGGFDERFHMYNEEVDLQRRLREQGAPARSTSATSRLSTSASDPRTRQMRERWQLSRGSRTPTSGAGAAGSGSRWRAASHQPAVDSARAVLLGRDVPLCGVATSSRPAHGGVGGSAAARVVVQPDRLGGTCPSALPPLVEDAHVGEASRLELRDLRSGET